MNIFELSGLELLSAMVAGDIPPPPISKTIPMTLDYVESGMVRFIAKADANHLNPAGGVHGGFAATVLDTVTGCAVHSVLEAGIKYGTIELNVKMMRPIPQNTDLIAEGRLINRSRNLGVSQGEIKHSAGKLYAHATCTCSIINPITD